MESSCDDVDSVTISISIGGGESQELDVYCGSKRTLPTLMSSDTTMEVVLRSRSASKATGFEAVYNFVTGSLLKFAYVSL